MLWVLRWSLFPVILVDAGRYNIATSSIDEQWCALKHPMGFDSMDLHPMDSKL
jgi:hypothetical protein